MAMENETVDRICEDTPVYVMELARKLIPHVIADGLAHFADSEEIYQNIFLSGYYTAKAAQKIELEDIMLNGG